MFRKYMPYFVMCLVIVGFLAVPATLVYNVSFYNPPLGSVWVASYQAGDPFSKPLFTYTIVAQKGRWVQYRDQNGQLSSMKIGVLTAAYDCVDTCD